MVKILENVNGIKDRLFTINDKEPLSKLSLVVIIALDIFILSVVFQGLDDHTRQLTSPTEYIPYDCRQALIEQNWTDVDKMSNLQRLVLSDHDDYAYRHDSLFDSERINKMHPVCKDFYLKIQAISQATEVVAQFKKRESYLEQKNKLTEAFQETKDVYDTSLLENIAGDDNEKLASISDAMRQKAQQIEYYNLKIADIERRINNHAAVKEFWAFISPGTNHKEVLVSVLKKFEFWYPLKELAWQFLFLFPLWFIFYFWMVRSVKKDNALQVLISSHLIVIVSIPILFKIINVILKLIPRHFFKAFFKILNTFHIIALWHYFVIIGSIGLALLMIYVIQKKIFNQRRLQLKRLMKGACYSCGKKLPEDASVCPFCGVPQLQPCPSCNNRTYTAGQFCRVCGQEQTLSQ